MVVYALLIAHLLADFYFQSNLLAEGKLKSIPFALLHFIIYTVTLGIPLALFVAQDQIWISLLFIAGSHFLIDGTRILIERKIKPNYPIVLFAIDQALHILIILCVYWFFLKTPLLYDASSFISRCRSVDAVTLNNTLLYVLIFLLVLLPEAIIVKKLLQSFPKQKTILEEPKPMKSSFKAIIQRTNIKRDGIVVQSYMKKPFAPTVKPNTEKSDQNMGLVIGMIERILVAVFILFGQYSSIAFVITAKSIARFKQLEDQTFAEKYLIGTLSSVALSMLTTSLLSSFLIQ